MDDLPLTGCRVVDFTMNMSGPFATMLLADQGAEVLKVEPPEGDPIRRVGSGSPGLSAYFANLNRNKQSVVVDLHSPSGRADALALVRTADVVVQNFRVGVAERLGIGADQLRGSDASLVHASISGFGRTGPLCTAPAYDHVIQAMSGLAARQASGDGEPALVRHGIVDKATGYATAQAITAALVRRARSGQGATIDIAMLDVAIGLLWPDGMMDRTCVSPEVELPSIARTFRLTETADGFVSMVTLTDRQGAGLIAAADLEADDRATSVEGRMRHGGDVMREVRRRFSTMTTDEVVRRLRDNDVPSSEVVTLDDLVDHVQIAAIGAIREFEHPVLGAIRLPQHAARFQGIDDRLEPAPRLGEHTERVLTKLVRDHPAEADTRD